MYVKTHRIAYLALFASFSVVLMFLGNVMAINTLFFLAAASFMVGVVILEWGLGAGFMFLVVCGATGLLVMPQKLYCLTYLGFGLYIWFNEFLFRALHLCRKDIKKYVLFWILKGLIFNIMYIPMLLVFPKVIFPAGLPKVGLVPCIIVGQVAFVVFDLVYVWFQRNVWNVLRKKIMRSAIH